jgi:LmbE family N-acetylglucosaminyl deacetylase
MRGLARRLYRARLHRGAQDYPAADLGRSAVVFAPHPDDETLGCGGTVLRKKAAGAKVHIVLMTDGSSAFPGLIIPEELTKLRYAELIEAAGALGIGKEDVFFLGFKDGQLNQHEPAATEKVAEMLGREPPAEIYVPYYSDGPPDHEATTRAVLAAAARAVPQATIFEYPVWYWYHWPIVPAQGGVRGKLGQVRGGVGISRRGFRDFRCRVAVADLLERKRAALNQHHTQMEKLVNDPKWHTLPSVADGAWLECFFQPYEVFYRHAVNTG